MKSIVKKILTINVSLMIFVMICRLLFYYIIEMMYMRINKKYILKPKYNSIIPLNLFTSWHTKNLSPKMYANVRSVRLLNPEFNFYLFDNDDCLSFIKKYFDEDVVYAYNKLIPQAYKSDLWRYCVLYIYGGIYYDIKFRCVNGFKFIALTEKEELVRDLYKDYVYNGLLIFKKGNKILKRCIRRIVYNCKKNYYGKNSLCPTGPGLVGYIVNKNYKSNMKYYIESYPMHNFTGIVCKDTKTVILEKYNQYRSEQKTFKNKYYQDLWKERNIYN